MSALNGNKHAYMLSAIQVLQNRMVGYVNFDLTHEDFLNLFVSQHLHETAIEVPKYFHLPYRSSNVQHSVALASVNQTCTFVAQLHETKGKIAPMVPREIIKHPEENPQFMPVLEVLEQMSDMTRRFALAKRVLTELDKRCSTPQQMRFLWPTMLVLMDNSVDDATKNAANKLRAVRAPKTFPALPAWLRMACKDSSEIITAASLIPDKAVLPVEVTMTVKSLSSFDYHGETIRCDI